MTEKRLETVDCLRGIAAVAVLICHITNHPLLTDQLLKEVGKYGRYGVEVFFVISGFILPYAMHRSGYRISNYTIFIGKRLLRIEPPYLACIAIIIGLNYASSMAPSFHGPPFHIDTTNLLMHLGYLANLFGEEWLNVVFWTLALEFQFYILAGIFFPLLISPNTSYRIASSAILALTPFLITNYYLVFRWLSLFGLGIWIFQIRSELIKSRTVQVAGLIALGASAAFSVGPIEACVGIATALLLLKINLRIPILIWLGKISYPLYLIHLPIATRVINLGSRFANNSTELALVFIAATIACLISASLFHRWIELPSQRLAARIRYKSA